MAEKKKEYTREEIIQALKEADAESDKPIGARALSAKGIREYWIRKLFPEGLTEVKRKLGLKLSPQEQPRSDDELLEEIDRTVSKLQRVPSWIQLRHETGIDDSTFLRRFGVNGIRELFSFYREWLKKEKPKSGNIQLVNAYLEGKDKTRTRVPRRKGKTGASATKWAKVPGREYGAPLNFGSMIYEPTCEQGVVFLFGMVAKRLGFWVEYVSTEFPDCVAKRVIEGKKKRLQDVKIEFEFKSREYEKSHPTEGLDGYHIIVCWEDNWGEDCPLEVIELKREIKKLRELPEFR